MQTTRGARAAQACGQPADAERNTRETEKEQACLCVSVHETRGGLSGIVLSTNAFALDYLVCLV
jgi:hypothetical protein